MSVVGIGAIGGMAGLFVAIFANLVVLPFVLKSQDAFYRDGKTVPVFGWDKRRLVGFSRFAYRFVMPVMFVFVGAFAAVEIFGDAR